MSSKLEIIDLVASSMDDTPQQFANKVKQYGLGKFITEMRLLSKYGPGMRLTSDKAFEMVEMAVKFGGCE